MPVKAKDRKKRKPKPGPVAREAEPYRKAWRSNSPEFVAAKAEIWEEVHGFPCATRDFIENDVDDGVLEGSRVIKAGTFKFPKFWVQPSLDLAGEIVNAYRSGDGRKWVIELEISYFPDPQNPDPDTVKVARLSFMEGSVQPTDPDQFGTTYIVSKHPAKLSKRKEPPVEIFYESKSVGGGKLIERQYPAPSSRWGGNPSVVCLMAEKMARGDIQEIPEGYLDLIPEHRAELLEYMFPKGAEQKRLPYEEQRSNLVRRLRGTADQRDVSSLLRAEGFIQGKFESPE